MEATKIIAIAAGKKINYYANGRKVRSSARAFTPYAVVYFPEGRTADAPAYSFHSRYDLAFNNTKSYDGTRTIGVVVKPELVEADDPRAIEAKASEAAYIAERKAAMNAAKKLTKNIDPRISASGTGSMFHMTSNNKGETIYRWQVLEGRNGSFLTGSSIGDSVSFDHEDDFLTAVEQTARKLSDKINDIVDTHDKVMSMKADGASDDEIIAAIR